MTSPTTPHSTYRIQFNKDFRFLDGRDIIPYLHELGIGAVYSSPHYRARRGSSHGYDVSSPLRVNSDLGTDDEFDELCEKLQHYGMGLVLDIVPNHMVASHENPWWMDVLENGPSSRYAHYFDIDWRPAATKAAFLQEDKVLLPVLGDLYGKVLENRQFSVKIDDEGFFLSYFDRRFPLDPKSYQAILDAWLVQIDAAPDRDAALLTELRKLRKLAAEMPPFTSTSAEDIAKRVETGQALKQRCFAFYRDSSLARQILDVVLAALSGISGDMESLQPLHTLLDQQPYRLAHWKIAFEEINYRRFFDINDLVCLCAADDDVFIARHRGVLSLLAGHKVTGLRVDHVDGIQDPSLYLSKLDQAARDAAGAPVYIVVEKILGRDEPLPQWKAHGTTGYDFLNALNDLFLDPKGIEALSTTYAKFTADATPFGEVCYARNKQVMRELFAGEVNALGHHLGRLAAQDRNARDVPLSELVDALVEVSACLPVYRTYIRDPNIGERDRFYLERTLDLARKRTSELRISNQAFEFLRRVLLLDPPPYATALRDQFLQFLMRWQQFTGPVMAKGLEDTAFYFDSSLISRNEVGGDALRETPPLDLDGFHRFCAARQKEWPVTMNATSTHDTKRSEDVRARINVLSEMPEEWEKLVLRWRRWNRAAKHEIDGVSAPSPAEEMLIYQTLVGAWPFQAAPDESFLDRIHTFLVKALREAKTHSRWSRPNEPYEAVVLQFSSKILESNRENPFLSSFLRFQERIAWHGVLNSLSQTLAKITAPGIPDFYQGSETWDLSLVDPDNRRSVDFKRRIAMLECLRKVQREAPAQLIKDLLANWQDGRIKLFLTERALDLRRTRTAVYLEGAYSPVEAAGGKSRNVCAFARHKNGSWCLTVVPRFTSQLAPFPKLPVGKSVWRDTRLNLPDGAPNSWQNYFTGEILEASTDKGGSTLNLHDVLRRFPVALLVNHAPARRRTRRSD